MARIYYTRGPTTATEGDPLDAHIARTLIQRNLEAVTEEARQDYVSILPASDQATSGYYFGPSPVIARRDRDGLWRAWSVQPLCCGGTSQRTLTGYITAGNATPSAARDPYAEWTVAAGLTNIWQIAETITIPREWTPWPATRYPSGDEDGDVAIGWLSFAFDTWAGANPPQIAGFRATELVADIV
jgi:hypothetical protein